MIADKDYANATINHKDTTLALIYLDKELLTILLAHIFSEVREVAAPEDMSDTDDMIDRINYIIDLSESLDVIQDAIKEIGYQERLDSIPPEVDEE